MNLLDIAIAKKMSGGGGSEPVIESLSVTENGTYTAPSGVDGYSPVTVNVSGGGGGSDMILLTEKSLGNVSVTSTSETVVGTVSFTSDTDYDMYIAVISRSEVQGNYHYATASTLLRIGTSNRATDGPGNTSYANSSRWNCTANSNGTINTAQSGRGLYIGNLTRQGTETTLTIAGIYNSSGTKTINGEYSIQVYGINLYGLIG